MGAYTCQFGTVHKRCRCLKPHTMRCPTPTECQAQNYRPKHRADVSPATDPSLPSHDHGEAHA